MDFTNLIHVEILNFDVLSNFGDFSRQDRERYRQTVFSSVIYVYQLVFSRKILNRLPVRFLKKSILAISPMSESQISTIFQTWPIFLEKTVRDIAKRFSLSYSTYFNLQTLSVF